MLAGLRGGIGQEANDTGMWAATTGAATYTYETAGNLLSEGHPSAIFRYSA